MFKGETPDKYSIFKLSGLHLKFKKKMNISRHRFKTNENKKALNEMEPSKKINKA